MSLKICVGSVFICAPRLPVSPNAVETVNSSGAVSPMPRATASSEPVIRPGSAVGSTTLRDHPPARSAQRQRGLAQALGTSSSTTSALRTTIGSISSDSATEPFQPVNDPPTG